jgi:F-type H+-transporting ATPase subunit epsilon
MATALTVRLVTPQGKLLDAQASYVSVPAHDGLIGFQPGRAPIVFELGLGEMKVTFAGDGKNTGGGSRSFFVDSGFAQMVDNKLTVLTSKAAPADEIDPAAAKAELVAAEARKSSNVQEMDAITRQRDAARVKVRLAGNASARGI